MVTNACQFGGGWGQSLVSWLIRSEHSPRADRGSPPQKGPSKIAAIQLLGLGLLYLVGKAYAQTTYVVEAHGPLFQVDPSRRADEVLHSLQNTRPYDEFVQYLFQCSHVEEAGAADVIRCAQEAFENYLYQAQALQDRSEDMRNLFAKLSDSWPRHPKETLWGHIKYERDQQIHIVSLSRDALRFKGEDPFDELVDFLKEVRKALLYRQHAFDLLSLLQPYPGYEDVLNLPQQWQENREPTCRRDPSLHLAQAAEALEEALHIVE